MIVPSASKGTGMSMWKSVVVAVAIGLAGSLAAQAQTRDLLRVGVDVDAGTLDPRRMRDTTAFRATDLIHDGLVSLGPDMQPRPALATRWETPDPTTFVFHLREGVTFHDGRPFTADDVVFTYRSILDPAFNAPFRALLAPIQSVEAVDPRTVRIRLSAPYAPLLSYLDVGIVSKAASDAGVDFNLNPVGTGPMRLQRWDRGSRVTLVPNDAYWGPKAQVRELRLVVIGDNTARAQAFEAGDLDFIQSPLSPQDVRRLQRDTRFANLIGSGVGVTYLNFNTGDPALADPRVRRALARLVDRQTIVEQIYQGTDTVASSILMPSSWAFSDQIRQPTFDTAAAVRELGELGWRPVAGRLQREGRPLSITIGTHSEDPNRVQTVEFLQATFAAAGIDARVQVSDWPSFSGGVQNSRHQIGLLGWLNIVDPDRLMYAQLHSRGGLNWGKYSNPQVDAALDAGRSGLTIAERTAAYRRAAEIIAAEVPYLIISYQGYQAFHSRALGTLALNPRGYLRQLLGPGL
jgi:peptide/nickel transport system substrate-binding protein